MQEFINEYQRKHYEACMRAQENSKKHPLSSAEMRSIAHKHREMVRASATPSNDRRGKAV